MVERANWVILERLEGKITKRLQWNNVLKYQRRLEIFCFKISFEVPKELFKCNN